MRIESIEIYWVSMPLIYPFRTAFGNDDTIESILVKMTSGGYTGWGEASPWRYPAYSPEFAGGAFQVARDFLAPCLIGKEISSGDELQSELNWVKGNYFAKAALDTAWWDLYAQSEEKPLWKIIGGTSATVEVGADFGIMENLSMLIDAIQTALDNGFLRIKLKYRPGWELEMIRKVRENFPKATFHIDCNSAYTLDDLEMFRKLDEYNLAMIEQPLMHNDLLAHAKLQAAIKTPICLDESITSPEKAQQAIEIGACGWINIKPGRVGGITHALKIHELCRNASIPCWIGGMLESAVGANHCLALATLPNIKYPSDIFPSERFYVEDLGSPSIKLSAPSKISAREAPGIGCAPRAELLEKQTLQRAIIHAE